MYLYSIVGHKWLPVNSISSELNMLPSYYPKLIMFCKCYGSTVKSYLIDISQTCPL